MQINANGVTLNCTIDRNPDAPWVVLAHGIANDMSIWADVAARLGSRFNILRFDARGHGGSESVGGDYTFDMLTSDSINLMNALEIPRAHYVGISLGGMVGLGLALDHPDRLLSLVCCDARASVPADYRTAWVNRRAAVLAEGMEPIVEQSMARWFAPGFRERQPGRSAQVEAMIRRTSPNGYCGCAAALLTLDYFRHLGRIATPTLYVVGEYDQGAPPPTVREMQEATPGAQYVEIPAAGHLSCIEQPAAVADALAKFFNDHSEPDR
jgi:3-oxoadipate enol-lactonase